MSSRDCVMVRAGIRGQDCVVLYFAGVGGWAFSLNVVGGTTDPCQQVLLQDVLWHLSRHHITTVLESEQSRWRWVRCAEPPEDLQNRNPVKLREAGHLPASLGDQDRAQTFSIHDESLGAGKPKGTAR